MSVHSVYQKPLPPETFPSLKISPKCVCFAPDPAGELTALPIPPSWIKGREGYGKGGKSKGGKGEEVRERMREEGEEGK